MIKELLTPVALAATFLAPAAIASGETRPMLTSWYGPGFVGNLTANGEVYTAREFTAAHKELPFGTKLKVCYDSCVTVRINDRGPYIGQRELDLSQAAAEAIGLIGPGVANTTVTFL